MSKVIDLTGKPQSEWYSNPNLLDNWYFADPIDQRQGYVVPPDTPYYSDTGLSAQAGAVAEYTTAAYTTAEYADGVYGSVTVDGAEYYVDWTAAVRGYADAEYTVDRWRTDRSTILLYDDYIRVVAQPGTAPSKQWWRQPFETPITKGTHQVSALLRKGRADMHLRVGEISAETSAILENSTDWQLASITISENNFHNGQVGFICVTSDRGIVAGDYFDIIAAKLELGPTQTLAHQDADGNWVLNDPPPNRAIELAKCQRYQVVLSGTGSPMAYIFFGRTNAGDQKVVTFSVPLNVAMRRNPAIADFAANKVAVTNIRTGEKTEGTLNQYGTALEIGVQIGITIEKEWGTAVPCMCEVSYTSLPLVLDSNL